MRAIILAAGVGKRMGKITHRRTKGMVSVNGKKLIDHILDFLELNIIDEAIVVGGYYFKELKEHVDNRNLKNVKAIENKNFHKGNIFSLIRGLKEFSGDSFLITNVDHIYPRAMFKKMKESFKHITAMCDFDRELTDDDMKVKLKKCNGSISIDQIRKGLNDYNCGYIGMTYVDISMEEAYRNAIQETLKRRGDGAVVEDILQTLAEDEKTAPQICDLSGFQWHEVDTEDDLIRTEKDILTNKQLIKSTR
ncbi:MAG: NTP transferase domain-containing protein [Spirochaetota bacterium]|nr:NTP transferase domain-containing protein [Spirochaetota bacterium]